jgi:hypothetical protein
MWMICRLSPALAIALAGCVASPTPPQVSAAQPPFAPIAFFSGHTEGRGLLKVFASRARSVHVMGTGRIGPDGTLNLTQRVEQDGKKPRTRTWSIKGDRNEGYESVLSDASGPVLVTVESGRLHIRFRAKGDLRIEQWLALDPGERVARNHLVVRKFGIRVATLDETISKID